MSSRSKLFTTLALLIFLGGLSAADYFLSGADFTASVTEEPHIVVESSSASSEGQSNANAAAESTASVAGVKKQNGPDIKGMIESNGFTTAKSDNLSFLAQVTGGDAAVHSLAILQNGDRAGSVTWVEGPDVKNQFIALKEALLTAFSPQVHDLKDETLQGNNLPVRNRLSFIDASLSLERLTFVRVRERLYEFHIATGKDEAMNALIETMTTK